MESKKRPTSTEAEEIIDNWLTHWGRVTHICVSNLTIIGSDNGLSPGRRQAIIWTNVGILLIGPPGTNFSEMLIEIHTFSFKKIHLKMSSGKWRPFCLGPNVLSNYIPSVGWHYSTMLHISAFGIRNHQLRQLWGFVAIVVVVFGIVLWVSHVIFRVK